MWLLFLVSYWFRCDAFNCIHGYHDCCINETIVWSIELPGHYCSDLDWGGPSKYSKNEPHRLMGVVDNSYYYCLDYKYVPPDSTQLMPTSTPARTYAKLTVRSHSKTETDLAVTLATALFQ